MLQSSYIRELTAAALQGQIAPGWTYSSGA